MSLRTIVLLIGSGIILLQLIAFYGFSAYTVLPEVNNLEKSLVVKNLHRNLKWLQQELLFLENITSLLASSTLGQNILNNKQVTKTERALKQEMLQKGINLIYILNEKNELIWESVLDLNTEQPILMPSFLPQLWSTQPNFFKQPITQAGIYNSILGPLLLASTPLSQEDHAKGTLVIGKLVTSEFTQWAQVLTYTDVQIWPMGSDYLNSKQQNVIKELEKSNTDFTIETGNHTLRGFISYPTLNPQFPFILSVSQTRDFSQWFTSSLFKLSAVVILPQILFLIYLSLLLRHSLSFPLYQLIQRLNASKSTSNIPEAKGVKEIQILNQAFAQWLSRYEIHLEQECAYAYNNGAYHTQKKLQEKIGETIAPLIESIAWHEKKLSNLPLNELEKTIAEMQSDPNVNALNGYIEKLRIINKKISAYQKEGRFYSRKLNSKTSRNLTNLRQLARELKPRRHFFPLAIFNHKDKELEKMTRYSS